MVNISCRICTIFWYDGDNRLWLGLYAAFRANDDRTSARTPTSRKGYVLAFIYNVSKGQSDTESHKNINLSGT